MFMRGLVLVAKGCQMSTFDNSKPKQYYRTMREMMDANWKAPDPKFIVRQIWLLIGIVWILGFALMFLSIWEPSSMVGVGGLVLFLVGSLSVQSVYAIKHLDARISKLEAALKELQERDRQDKPGSVS